MANVKNMIQHINNIEIYYSRYIVKITFDFIKLKFKAYTECGMNCMSYETDDKPVCYIELEDFLNWLTLMKLKGTLR